MPEKVQETFCKYDAGLFLTKAENFGHALYESLSCARPIITSNFTPWRNLESQFAGWNVDISDLNVVLRKLNIIADMDNAQFENYCKGAYNLAMHYYENGVIKNEYQKLF